MDRDKYQTDLSLHSPILMDEAYKAPKVRKMLAILADAGALDRGGLAVDVGCSGGLFVAGLGPHFREVVGIDIDPHALRSAAERRQPANVGYVLGDSQCLPLSEGSVDVVICNHVYEHVPDARRLFAEIERVLRPGGVCYLGAASRLAPLEPHYHLPFLSWLPKRLAHIYMRVAGKGDRYYENLRTYWGLTRLIRQFDIVDYTLRVISEPDHFEARDMIPKNGLAERIPKGFLRLLHPLLPSYLLILRKPL
jgi:SAM-dependent methyltransferase